MTTRHTYHCNGCGAEVDIATAAQFAGIWQGQSTVAANGEHAWHSCSAGCAAGYLRAVAAKIEERGRELEAARAAHAADQAK